MAHSQKDPEVSGDNTNKIAIITSLLVIAGTVIWYLVEPDGFNLLIAVMLWLITFVLMMVFSYSPSGYQEDFDLEDEEEDDDEELAAQQSRWKTEDENLLYIGYWAVASAVLMAVIVAIFLLFLGSDSVNLTLVGIGYVLFLGAGIAMGINDQCPSCKALGAGQEVKQETIGRNTAHKTVTRQQKDNQGNVRSEWQEQIRVLRKTYRHYHKCSSCGYEWTTTSQAEYDSFDD